MNKKILLGAGGLAVAALLGLLYRGIAENVHQFAKAEAAIAEGEQLLLQAEQSQGSSARDLRVKALRKGEEALEAAPALVPALLLLGRAQSALGEGAKACQTFDRLLSLSPNDPAGLREAGVAYFERWKLSKDHAHRVEAEQDLERSLSLEPDSTRAMFYLGWLHHETGELEARDSVWGKLEKTAPDSQEARRTGAIKSP